jgi:hypothetical protein
MAEGPILVQIKWVANPFRGDRFEEAWLPAAEAALDYGATSWALYRNTDGRLDFIQTAVFPNKADFDRYWYSEEIAQVRENLQGWFQIPLLPTYWEISGSGSLTPVQAEPS